MKKGFELGALFKKIKHTILLLILLATYSVSCVADDFFTNARWDGYISQSLIHTTDNNFFGKSDDSISLDYTEIELLLSTTFLQDFQLSGSLLSRRAGESDNGEIRLDHGFITYTAFNNLDWTLGVRAGRIKASQGFYNETRDVAFTRPGILVPQSIYLERYRDWMFSADGLEFFTMRNWESNSLSFRLLMSNKDPNKETVEELLPYSIDGTVKDGISGVAKLLYDYDTGRLRLALTYGYLAYEVDNGYLGSVPDTEVSTSAVFLSAEYNTDKWKFVGEYVPTKNKMLNLLGGLPDQNTKGLSYYLQSTYRIDPKWEVMLRRGVLFLDKNDKNGLKYEAVTTAFGNPTPGHTTFAKNWVLGIGWHFSDSLLFRIEYYDVEGTGWIPSKDLANTEALHKDWEMLMFQTSYRF